MSVKDIPQIVLLISSSTIPFSCPATYTGVSKLITFCLVR